MQQQERLRRQYAASGIANAFVAARRDGRAITTYPGELPETLADAYTVQALAIDQWSDVIGGWKVARINEPWRNRLQTDRYIGPIFARTIVDAGFVSKVSVYEGGSAAFEAEIALVVGSDTDPERLSWSFEDARSLITDVRLVIEAASSPLASIATLGPLAAITAFGNNSGLIRGPSVDLTSLRGGFADVTIDGMRVGRSPLWDDPDGPLPAFTFALERAAALGYPLKRGQIVSTGALTGVHTVTTGQMGSARFADLATIDCLVTSRPANQ